MKYFCSNTGHNTSKDINNPGDFIETLSILSPGDILYLLPGEYFFDKTININCNGLKNNNISIEGYLHNYIYRNPETIIFNFKDIPYICDNYTKDKTKYYCENGNGINIYGNYVSLKNIIIKFAAFRGLENFGNHNIFENIETSYNCDSGHVQSGENNLIINCYSHHNFDYKFIKDGEIKFGFNSDGFADKLHNGNGNKYINCVSSFNGDDGYDFFQRETPDNQPTIIKNSNALYNGGKYIDMSKHERLINDIEYNDKYDISNYPNYGNGNGFKLGGIHKTCPKGYINYHHIELHNCNSLYNNKHGITGNHNSGNVKLINCVSSLNNDINFNFLAIDKCNVITENCYAYPMWNVRINDSNKL